MRKPLIGSKYDRTRFRVEWITIGRGLPLANEFFHLIGEELYHLKLLFNFLLFLPEEISLIYELLFTLFHHLFFPARATNFASFTGCQTADMITLLHFCQDLLPNFFHLFVQVVQSFLNTDKEVLFSLVSLFALMEEFLLKNDGRL